MMIYSKINNYSSMCLNWFCVLLKLKFKMSLSCQGYRITTKRNKQQQRMYVRVRVAFVSKVGKHYMSI